MTKTKNKQKPEFDLKDKPNYKIMQTFTLNNIPDLDICVLGALELFSEKELPKIEIPKKKMLVVGSGNALATGRIIFSDREAFFASESDYEEKLKNIKFDIGVIVSASGGKHSPDIIKKLKSKKLKTYLITNNKNALAKKHADKTFVLPKQKEPYTYNTSTYLSMIFAKEKENPKRIYEHLKKITKKIPNNLSKYDAFYIIVPPEFDAVKEMFVTKFDELFGPKILGRVYTTEQTKHAKTLVKSQKEFFISIGEENKIHGYKNNRLNIPLPKNPSFASIIATAYYVIGKIQKQNKPYFKENIERYTKEASKTFKQEIKPIVE